MSPNLIREITRMDRTCASFRFKYFVLLRLFEKRKKIIIFIQNKYGFNKYKSYIIFLYYIILYYIILILFYFIF